MCNHSHFLLYCRNTFKPTTSSLISPCTSSLLIPKLCFHLSSTPVKSYWILSLVLSTIPHKKTRILAWEPVGGKSAYSVVIGSQNLPPTGSQAKIRVFLWRIVDNTRERIHYDLTGVEDKWKHNLGINNAGVHGEIKLDVVGLNVFRQYNKKWL
ncbi:hypothetical protein OROGR_017196 [Orobanche gracilis]